MREIQLAGGFVGFKHREINNPAKRELVGIDQFQFLANAVAGASGKFGKGFGHTGAEKHRIAIFQPQLGSDLFGSFGPDIFGKRASAFALTEENIAQARLPLALRPTVHAVAKSTATAGFRRNSPHAHARILGNHIGENLEIRAVKRRCHILHFDGDPQVGLVRPVFLHGLGVRNKRKFFRHPLAIAEGLKQITQYRLDGRKNVFLRYETHLQIKLVKLARRTVGARVLIAETRRDLKIPVKACNHQKLFELLGCLRQGVKFARMRARRHQKITRPFGAGGRQNRRLIFTKAVRCHALAQPADNIGTQHNIAVQRIAAQIQKPVAQANIFRIIRFAENRQRQVARIRQNFQFRQIHFNVTGRQIRVARLIIARHNLAIGANDTFGTNLLGQRKMRAGRLDNQLGEAIMVAHIYE